MTKILATNYDFLETFTITDQDGNVVNVSGATIEAGLTSPNGADVYISGTAQSDGTTGADWPNGVVAVNFPMASTDLELYGTGRLEISVTNGGLKTFYQFPLRIVRGRL